MAQPYVGEIRIWPGNFNPVGWEFCMGQQLPISENETLFQLIGTTYGGDGEETFNLPNLQGRVPIHMGTGPGGQTFQIADLAGIESVTLTTQQIPNHTHPLTASEALGTTAIPTNNVLAQSQTGSLYQLSDPDVQMATSSISPAGGSQPHENMQPFLVLNFIISLFGIFPSQT